LSLIQEFTLYLNKFNYSKICIFVLPNSFYIEALVNNLTFQTPLSFISIFWLIFFGILIKIGVGPLAFWLPDVYSTINLPTLLLFSTISKIGYMIILLQIFKINFVFFYNDYYYFFFLSISICSLIIGIFGLFHEKQHIFRFVGWSSIINYGLVFISLGFFSLSEEFFNHIAQTIIFFVVCYSWSLLCFLLVFVFLIFAKPLNRVLIYLTDLQVLVRHFDIRFIYWVLCGSLFSFFGLPPFVGFWAKFFLLKGIVLNIAGFWEYLLVLFIFLSLLISNFSYIRIYNLAFSEILTLSMFTSLIPVPVNYIISLYQLFVISQIIFLLWLPLIWVSCQLG
jgi:NADH-quinone oxidoreductase subunit N